MWLGNTVSSETQRRRRPNVQADCDHDNNDFEKMMRLVLLIINAAYRIVSLLCLS